MKTKWTKKKLLNQMMAILRRGSTTISLNDIPSRKDQSAGSEWVGTKTDIFVDPHQAPIIGAVIHELLHQVLEKNIGHFTYEVEEPMIQALEDKLVNDLKGTAALETWRKEINRKLTKKS